MKSIYLLWAIVVLDIIDSPLSSCSCDRDNEFVPSVEETQQEQSQDADKTNTEAFAVTE